MNTGNRRDLRACGNKYILDVTDAGEPSLDPGGYDHRYTARVRGWGNGHVGSGPTREAAIRVLARDCGVTVERLLSECVEG